MLVYARAQYMPLHQEAEYCNSKQEGHDRPHIPASAGRRVSKYSDPVTIERVRNNVVTLENGQTWGMDKLAKCGKKGCQNHAKFSTIGQGSRSNAPDRNRSPPKWHKDYVLT